MDARSRLVGAVWGRRNSGLVSGYADDARYVASGERRGEGERLAIAGGRCDFQPGFAFRTSPRRGLRGTRRLTF